MLIKIEENIYLDFNEILSINPDAENRYILIHLKPFPDVFSPFKLTVGTNAHENFIRLLDLYLGQKAYNDIVQKALSNAKIP